MKKTKYLCLFLLGAFCLVGCGHKHQWEEATCDTAKTCVECGETEGEVPGHDYEEATCTEPAICKICGKKDGEKKGHLWDAATCQTPETCSVCGTTMGEPAAHDEYYFGSCDLCGLTQYTGLLELIDEKMDKAYYALCESLETTGEDTEKGVEAFYEKLGTLNILMATLPTEDDVYEALGFRTLQDVLVILDSVIIDVMYTSRMPLYDECYALFEEAYNLCGDYEELKEVKKEIKSVMDCVPRAVPELSEEVWAEYDVPFFDCMADEAGMQMYESCIEKWQNNYLETIAELIEIDAMVQLYEETLLGVMDAVSE